jgi:hypothetical protein
MANTLPEDVRAARAAVATLEPSVGARKQAAAPPPPPPPLIPPGDAIPRVAIMFLTRGPLPHARVWDEWLAGANGGLLPVPAVSSQHRWGCCMQANTCPAVYHVQTTPLLNAWAWSPSFKVSNRTLPCVGPPPCSAACTPGL